MAFWNKKETKNTYKPYISEFPRTIQEEFKGEVMDVLKKFPKELGAEHPFDFEKVEEAYCRIGIVSAIVNGITDSIVGDFSVKSKNKNIQAIINNLIKETNFQTILRPWVREAVSKGNGFIELDLKNLKLRVMNANNMYVLRDKKSNILGYNQFIGNLNRLTLGTNLLINFKPEQIAHLAFNKIPNDPYGIGTIWPNMVTINYLAGAEISSHQLIERKAGAPIHVKIGQPGETVQNADIDDFKSKLQYMNHKTEWVTDGSISMEVLDFKDLGKNITEIANHDIEQIAIGTEIPLVYLGVGNIPEGLAIAQGEKYQRSIQSKRLLVQSVIEEKIFKPILKANGLSGDIEFIWELPGEDEKNKRLTTISNQLSNSLLSAPLRAALEIEYATVLGLEEDLIKSLDTPDDAKAKQEERKEEEEIEQPEVPGAKQKTQMKLSESEIQTMTIQEWVNLKEIAGFNYSDYLIRILAKLRKDKFDSLSAITEQDLFDGLLSKKEIEKLRIILKDGFRKNQTIRQIEEDIRQNIPLKDRISEGKIILGAESRPNNIARTETVRLANEGLVDLYKENNIKQVQFLAAVSDRTCELCESLNGRIFEIANLNIGENQPPIHSNCRCSLLSITE